MARAMHGSAARMLLEKLQARAISALSALALLVLAVGCTQCSHGANRPTEARRQIPADLEPIGVPAAELRLAAAGANDPTLILDASRIARLKQAAKKQTPAWQRLGAICDERAQKPVASGYQGFEWADAIASLALCFHATGDARYGRAGVGYLRALVDDRYKLGDGKGGA